MKRENIKPGNFYYWPYYQSIIKVLSCPTGVSNIYKVMYLCDSPIINKYWKPGEEKYLAILRTDELIDLAEQI